LKQIEHGHSLSLTKRFINTKQLSGDNNESYVTDFHFSRVQANSQQKALQLIVYVRLVKMPFWHSTKDSKRHSW
jgi:hypothetical protein